MEISLGKSKHWIKNSYTQIKNSHYYILLVMDKLIKHILHVSEQKD